jgi:hypothetical protein
LLLVISGQYLANGQFSGTVFERILGAKKVITLLDNKQFRVAFVLHKNIFFLQK